MLVCEQIIRDEKINYLSIRGHSHVSYERNITVEARRILKMSVSKRIDYTVELFVPELYFVSKNLPWQAFRDQMEGFGEN